MLRLNIYAVYKLKDVDDFDDVRPAVIRRRAEKNGASSAAVMKLLQKQWISEYLIMKMKVKNIDELTEDVFCQQI